MFSNRIPFSESEIDRKSIVSDAKFRQTPFGEGDSKEILFDSPVPRKENFINAIRRGNPMWLASARESRTFTPRCIPDNEARGLIVDGGDPVPTHPEGFKDMFGVEWVYVDIAGGSMVRPGNPLLEDVNDWKELVKFPDIASYDWEKQFEISKEYVSDPLFAPVLMIQTGFFERLISFMDFEGAAIAIVDEDQKDAVHELFNALADLYIEYIDIVLKYFDIVGVEIHDDWGSQRAPFFSPKVASEIIVPYIRRVVDYVHSKGLFYMMHSCGHIAPMVPAMIEAGVDFWTPQYPVNDQSFLFATYGKQIGIAVVPPFAEGEMPEEEIYALAEQFVNEFVDSEAPTAISIYSPPNNHPLMDEAIYRLSRIKLCGKV